MSITKKYSKDKAACEVSFHYVNYDELHPQTVFLVGDFNNWVTDATPMQMVEDGSFRVTISLDAFSTYQFRYLIDGEHWENDDHADNYDCTPFGSYNSVVNV